MDDVEILISLITMVVSTLSFAPTMIIVFRRLFRGQHSVCHRANGYTLAALMIFQLIMFVNSWSYDHWSSPLLLVLVGVTVCSLNLLGWREWSAFVQAEARAASGDAPGTSV